MLNVVKVTAQAIPVKMDAVRVGEMGTHVFATARAIQESVVNWVTFTKHTIVLSYVNALELIE